MIDPKDRMWDEAINQQLEASPKNGRGCIIPFIVLLLFFGSVLWLAYHP